MRARTIGIVITCYITTMLCACVPVRIKETPEISGVVVDVSNGDRVIGAKLSYVDFPDYVVTTNSLGIFRLKAIHRWQVVMLGTDLQPSRLLVISATGFSQKNVIVDIGGPKEYTIALQPLVSQ